MTSSTELDQSLFPPQNSVYTNKLSCVVKSQVCRDASHHDTSNLFGRQCLNCGTLTVYADDSMYIVSSKTRQSNQTNLRRCLDEINLFLLDNHLMINQPKTYITEYMLNRRKAGLQVLLPVCQSPLNLEHRNLYRTQVTCIYWEQTFKIIWAGHHTWNLGRGRCSLLSESS